MNEFRMTSSHTGGAALTGNGAVNLVIENNNTYKLAEMRLTLGTVSTDLADFSVRLDSEMGAPFGHILGAPDPDDDLFVTTSFRIADQVPPIIFPGDKVVITWPNAGGVIWAIDLIGLA